MQKWITSQELTERRKAQAQIVKHTPCCRCKRTEPEVTFSKRSTRCTDCNAEAQRRSRVNTGKLQPTMIG